MRMSLRSIMAVMVGLILGTHVAVSHSDDNLPHFRASIPSCVQEATLVWNLLQNISFHDSNRYVLSMPQSEVTAVLLQKARENRLESNDRLLLKNHFDATIYNEADYRKGYQAITDVLAIANAKVTVFKKYHDQWGFFLPSQYDIRLTLYGPGGSYDPKTGTIIMMTTKEGSFKRGNNPLETLLHEAVHIGIENRIVKEHKLSHWTKERIVDQFMIRHFRDVCPGYRMQPNTDTGIDTIFEEEDAWDSLPDRVRRYASH